MTEKEVLQRIVAILTEVVEEDWGMVREFWGVIGDLVEEHWGVLDQSVQKALGVNGEYTTSLEHCQAHARGEEYKRMGCELEWRFRARLVKLLEDGVESK